MKSERIIKNSLKSLIKRFAKGDFANEILTDSGAQAIIDVPLDEMVDNKFLELAPVNIETINSIKKIIKDSGFGYPLLVRNINNKYEIISGRAKYYASKELGLKRVPVLTRKLNDEEVLFLLLINMRETKVLNLYEFALVADKLKKDFHYKSRDIANIMDFSESQVSNVLHLLILPKKIISYSSTGELTYGHLKVISRVNLEYVEEIAAKIIDQKLSVRQSEELVKTYKNKEIDTPFSKPRIEAKEKKIILNFENDKDLENALKRLNKLIKRKKI